jgi:uncharacterized protein (DUF3084 family)
MENQKSNSSLKAVVAILAILLVGSLFYIYKISSKVDNFAGQLEKASTEKQSVMKDLEDLKATYDAAIAENSSMSEELIQERDKVVKLMDDLKKSNGDLSKYKNQVQALQGNLKQLMKDNEALKTQNTKLTLSRDSTVVVLGQAQKFNEVLVGQNEDLSKTVEKGSKLSILNLQTAAYKLKSSGKEIATDKASRADVLKISFTIAENSIAKSGDKEYYIQVIDSKNNVLGESKTVDLGEKTLVYSFISSVKYENKTVQVSQDLAGTDFNKGLYTVNVFDKDVLVSSANFTLK